MEVRTVTSDDGSEKFYRFYVCLEALKKTCIDYCRPIIGIDGCFMKNHIRTTLGNCWKRCKQPNLPYGLGCCVIRKH